mmetsp:Transcript_35282/g.35803  ORF Transcript_35282/g.35803 Transcript_35282/m.35803 type:complete len:80 (-) Transcript_35282:938-1177(-)
MEDLQHDIHSNMRAASLMIRRHTHQVIPFCSHLLSDSLYNPAKHVEKVFISMSFDGTNQSESFADSMDLFDNSYDYCLC